MVRKRANWNLGLEKGLVELLHYHNNDCYKSQNGWSSEAWNRIVKMFQERFKHVSFSRLQIQEKEKELKRDYNLLKEAKKQSGVHWNEVLGLIEAEPPIWDNILLVKLKNNLNFSFTFKLPIGFAIFHSEIKNFYFQQSYPQAKKFQTKPSPLFDSLGELYDGIFSMIKYLTFLITKHALICLSSH